MRRISAWLEIDSNKLPDCISSMLFSVEESNAGWLPVTVSPGDWG
ncbi:MAG: hypothetical protein U5L08_07760 [Xanthomonadales bacterium]|nr:hypothetical protein [Xanthomonadales bacterium]